VHRANLGLAVEDEADVKIRRIRRRRRPKEIAHAEGEPRVILQERKLVAPLGRAAEPEVRLEELASVGDVGNLKIDVVELHGSTR